MCSATRHGGTISEGYRDENDAPGDAQSGPTERCDAATQWVVTVKPEINEMGREGTRASGQAGKRARRASG